MANLFNTYLSLVQSQNNNNFSEAQRDFIQNILKGNSQWSALETLAVTVNIEQLNSLKAALEEEIGKTHYFSFQSPHWNYHYITTLKGVLSDVQGVLDQREKLDTYSKKYAEKYNKFAKRMDNLYNKTTENYHGTIMMPVNQGLEPRIGDSNGECFGYVAKWAAQILKKERPFGLDVNQQRTLQPILFNSLLARKYPEINHLAALTKEISIYQELQASVDKLISRLSGPKTSSEQLAINKTIDYVQNSDYVFYTSTEEMAQSLVDEAQKDPNKVYNLNVMTYIGGHALGFCFIDNKYHFFDSNSGWYRFDNDKDFISWFTYYYKQRGYESYYFNEYAISSYSLLQDPNKALETEEPFSWTWDTIAIVTLLSPILAIYFLVCLTDLFIVRGFRYLGMMVSDYFNSNDHEPELEELDLVDNPTLAESLPKSLEALDLAVNLNKPKEKVLQSESPPDYLDLSVGDNFKRSDSPSFFKVPNMVKSKVEIDVEQPQYRP
ncbi:hypothetical protein [Legionella fallonii]|uniref:Peptidase C58 YopT-type domain-containing protein n=1 Tax=Legionella fallonii LLAP-10 TaxID=1212491 RepID=A0A098G6B0_9GAMM|nr:hypothetical protein [Legionella fallonii]CEG57504.1 protein of unknown function [Legionella fallonii LLAP-10]